MTDSRIDAFLYGVLIGILLAIFLFAPAVRWIQHDTARLIETGKWHTVADDYWVDGEGRFECYTQAYLEDDHD